MELALFVVLTSGARGRFARGAGRPAPEHSLSPREGGPAELG